MKKSVLLLGSFLTLTTTFGKASDYTEILDNPYEFSIEENAMIKQILKGCGIDCEDDNISKKPEALHRLPRPLFIKELEAKEWDSKEDRDELTQSNLLSIEARQPYLIAGLEKQNN